MINSTKFVVSTLSSVTKGRIKMRYFFKDASSSHSWWMVIKKKMEHQKTWCHSSDDMDPPRTLFLSQQVGLFSLTYFIICERSWHSNITPTSFMFRHDTFTLFKLFYLDGVLQNHDEWSMLSCGYVRTMLYQLSLGTIWNVQMEKKIDWYFR